jgi:alkanesulfonate monooxygenase SsuD/methylene tetrahydromethanopterin reductase-like flavin-dependent oxidoreductase (luciferase family)
MAHLEFGWRVPVAAEDCRRAALLEHVREHLQQLSGVFASAWVADHLLPGESWLPVHGDQLEGWSTLCHLAAEFPTYKFGTMVLANPLRSPALLAKMAATEQLLTGGRLILGIGGGWYEAEHRSYGYDFPSAKVRLEQLGEAVQIIKALWTESNVTFRGLHYEIDGAYCNPRPAPVPPILIGGAGERVTLRLVASHADWWGAPAVAPSRYIELTGALRRHCLAVGREFDEIERVVTVNCLAIGRSRKRAQSLAEASPYYRMAPPEAAVVGEPDDIIEGLRWITEAGAKHVLLRFADFPSLEGATLFAEKVAPAFEAAAA